MKNRFTRILLTFLLTASGVNSQTVNNNGFEQLNYDGTLSYWGNVYIQSAWFDSLGVAHYDSIVYNGTYYYAPTFDAHNGNTAMELSNSWNFSTNEGRSGAAGVDDDTVFAAYGLANLIPTFATPFNPWNPFNFGFYYKYFPENGDTAYAEITLWDSLGNQLASGLILITDSTSTYTQISAPINYMMVAQADFYSLSIGTFYTVEPGSHEPSFGTRLIVDDVGFNFVTQSVNDFGSVNRLQVYPNPASDFIILKSEAGEIYSDYTITDISGRVVLRGLITGEKMRINTGIFESGIYLLKTEAGEGKVILHK